jgi:hypothetical protein
MIGEIYTVRRPMPVLLSIVLVCSVEDDGANHQEVRHGRAKLMKPLRFLRLGAAARS